MRRGDPKSESRHQADRDHPDRPSRLQHRHQSGRERDGGHERRTGRAGVLSQISVDKNVRDASTACDEKQAQFGVELSSDPYIYAMAQLGAATATNAQDRKLAQLYMESGRRSGAGLDPETRAQTTKLF